MAVYQTTFPSFLACSSDPSCARTSPGVRRTVIKSRNNRKFLSLVIVVSPPPVRTRLKVISLTSIFATEFFARRRLAGLILLIGAVYILRTTERAVRKDGNQCSRFS